MVEGMLIKTVVSWTHVLTKWSKFICEPNVNEKLIERRVSLTEKKSAEHQLPRCLNVSIFSFCVYFTYLAMKSL